MLKRIILILILTIQETYYNNDLIDSWVTLKWLRRMKNKYKATFFQFDIIDFYPSVLKEILLKSDFSPSVLKDIMKK